MSYLGNPLSSQNFPVDYFTGNGTQTNFTLSQTPASATAIQVYVGGVKQVSSIINPSYLVMGNILVLSAPPVNGTPIEVNYLGLLSQVNVPGTQTITGSMLSLSVANSFLYQTTTNGTANTFTLNFAPPTQNSIIVTANGITQYDYTLNGSTLQLNFTPPANQLLRVQSMALAQTSVPADGSVSSSKLQGNLVAPGTLTITQPVMMMSNTLSANTIVTSGLNGFSIGPLTQPPGTILQVAPGSRYIIL